MEEEEDEDESEEEEEAPAKKATTEAGACHETPRLRHVIERPATEQLPGASPFTTGCGDFRREGPAARTGQQVATRAPTAEKERRARRSA